MQMHVGNTRLRYWRKPLALNLLAEVTGNKLLHQFAFDLFREALPNHADRHLASPETGEPRRLLVLLQDAVGFPGHRLGGDFYRDLAGTGVFGLHRTQVFSLEEK